MAEQIAWTFPNGDKITVIKTETGVIVRGSGAGIGKLAVFPEGSNRVDIQVVE